MKKPKKIKCNVCGNDSHIYLSDCGESDGDSLEIDLNYDDTQNINVTCPNCDNTGYIMIKVVDVNIYNDNDFGEDNE